MNIRMWEVEWLEHTFPARVNIAIHLLFQRKFTHRKVTNEPMELLLVYLETAQTFRRKEGGPYRQQTHVVVTVAISDFL